MSLLLYGQILTADKNDFLIAILFKLCLLIESFVQVKLSNDSLFNIRVCRDIGSAYRIIIIRLYISHDH